MQRNIKGIQGVAAALALLCANAGASTWSDNSVGVRHGSTFSEAGVGEGIKKTISSFTHASGDRLGANYFTIDVYKSDRNDPAANSSDGAQELYGLYQRTFSLSALTGHSGGYGPLQDISLLLRADMGSKNTAFARRPRKYRVGLVTPIPVKAGGFWDVGLSAYKESNHNGIVGSAVSFDPTWSLTSAWNIPAGPGAFGGFLSVTGPKGRDGFGNKTKTETLLRAGYLFNIGQSGFKAGVAYEYWRNMYGNDERLDSTGGSRGGLPMLVVEQHF
jgi:nucleoside-specific outer membrane channel protein Tsx